MQQFNYRTQSYRISFHFTKLNDEHRTIKTSKNGARQTTTRLPNWQMDFYWISHSQCSAFLSLSIHLNVTVCARRALHCPWHMQRLSVWLMPIGPYQKQIKNISDEFKCHQNECIRTHSLTPPSKRMNAVHRNWHAWRELERKDQMQKYHHHN